MSKRRVYGARPTKRRRSTRVEQIQFLRDLLATVNAMEPPMTVRQVFYQATVRGVIDKTEAGYKRVQRGLVWLRENNCVEWLAIADNTRWMRKPDTYANPEEAVRDFSASYRKALWNDADCRVEVWLEKDALAGVIDDVTSELDVALMVTRGYASLSFLYTSAKIIEASGKPTFVYHLGDYDPSGQDAAANIERRLSEFAPEAEINFHQIAVRPWQITAWRLPTRPTKMSDSRAKNFAEELVELDAIEPQRLRDMVRDVIEQHLPSRKLTLLKAAEESERQGLIAWAETLAGKANGKGKRR